MFINLLSMIYIHKFFDLCITSNSIKDCIRAHINLNVI